MDEILRAQRQQAIYTAALYCLAVGFAFFSLFLARQQAHALCTFRGDLETRVAQGQKFLHDHPHGAFGFTRAEIENQIRNQQRAANSLQDLKCGLLPW